MTASNKLDLSTEHWSYDLATSAGRDVTTDLGSVHSETGIKGVQTDLDGTFEVC